MYLFSSAGFLVSFVYMKRPLNAYNQLFPTWGSLRNVHPCTYFHQKESHWSPIFVVLHSLNKKDRNLKFGSAISWSIKNVIGCHLFLFTSAIWKKLKICDPDGRQNHLHVPFENSPNRLVEIATNCDKILIPIYF